MSTRLWIPCGRTVATAANAAPRDEPRMAPRQIADDLLTRMIAAGPPPICRLIAPE